MCGICGFTGPGDRAVLKRMADILEHRGPNDYGYLIDRGINLGFRRLSIIDLSKKGNQPMANEDKTVFVIFNGEIYNFMDLRKDLEHKGHRFSSNTDTETIVHSYEEYGEDCMKLFNGMFAFAIWDMKRKKLILARDRMGVKPLYYHYDGKNIIFASEIKSILQNPDYKKRMSTTAFGSFLTFRYVPEPDTLFEGIKKVPPGHYIVFEKGKIEIKNYWHFDFAPQEMTEEYASAKLLELMKDSVKLRLISDVPLGLYLSGGIDSAIVTGLMSELTDKIETFSIGYNLPNFEDELRPARITAEHFGTKHHEFSIKEHPFKILEEVIMHCDEPMADPAALPTLKLSQDAKKHVTVVLMGQGSDEVFAGYEQYRIMKIAGKMPQPLRKLGPFALKTTPNAVLDRLFKYSSEMGEEGKKRFSDFLANYRGNQDDHLKIISIFTDSEKDGILANRIKSESSQILSKYFKYNDTLSNQLNADQNTFLPHLLDKDDKATMAYSIEGRVPFLDYRIVEFSRAIPSNLKIKGLNEKYILRKAMSKIIPKQIISRKKHRFFAPIHKWLEGEVMDVAKQLLSEDYIRKQKLFNYNHVKKVLDNYQSSRLYYARQLWTLYCFQIWHRLFIEEEKPIMG